MSRSPNNPFAPGFGYPPPALAGRSEFTHHTLARIRTAVGTDDLCTVVTGPRGVGKTAAVHHVMTHAKKDGWLPIYTVAQPAPSPKEDMPYTIVRKCERLLGLGLPGKRSVTGHHVQAAVVGGGSNWSAPNRLDGSVWEALLTVLNDSKRETRGVLLVVDELHNISESHIGPVSSAVLELTGLEKRKLAFIGLGLPHLEYLIMNNPGFTFLQRSYRAPMSHLSQADAEQALSIPLRAGGVTIAADDLRRLAAGTLGNGYAIQSAGKHLWSLCGGAGRRATADHTTGALRLMDADVDQRIVTPIWNRLSVKDIEYLVAMTHRDGPVQPAVMTRAMGDSARTYKKRLLDNGILVEISGGLLCFASQAVRKRALLERAHQEAVAVEMMRRRSEFPQSGTFS